MRPALRLISDSARWPKITAAIDAGAKQRITPQIKLASALLLFCGGRPHSDCAIAICGTGCDTPQYGQSATKSAKFPRQFVHCFKFTLRRCATIANFDPAQNVKQIRTYVHLTIHVWRRHPAARIPALEQIFGKFAAYDCQSVKGGRE